MLVVLTTTPNEDEAETLAKKLVEAKLAACVQVLPKMKSVYFWEGEVQSEPEHLLLIKTLNEKYPEVERFLKENHSYDEPEIVALDSEAVSDSYLKWMTETLTVSEDDER